MYETAYAVLVADEASLRPADIARALAAARKVPTLDLMGPARRAWGIIEEGVTKAGAEETRRALAQAGLAALAVPAGLLEDLPPPASAASLELSADRLGFCDRQGAKDRVPWEALSLIAAAVYTESPGRKAAPEQGPDRGKEILKAGFSLMTGIPTSLGMGPKPAEKTAEAADQVFLLDLYLKAPLARLRIEPRRFDFSCLKARMGYGIGGNLRILLEELTRHAPSAAASRGAKILLEGRPVREMGYDGPQDLDRESRWRLTLAALKASG